MYKRNAGLFRHKITLLRPSQNVRDELGGIQTTQYDMECILFAMIEQHAQTRQQIVGDYVTADTRYFVVRDIRALCPDINTKWRLKYNGLTYLINKIDLIDESQPCFVQLTATAINGGGGIV